MDLSRCNSTVEQDNQKSAGERRLLQHKQRKLLSQLGELFGEVGLMDRVPLKAARGSLFNSTADQILAAPLRKLFGGIHVQFQSCVNGARAGGERERGGREEEQEKREQVGESEKGRGGRLVVL